MKTANHTRDVGEGRLVNLDVAFEKSLVFRYIVGLHFFEGVGINGLDIGDQTPVII